MGSSEEEEKKQGDRTLENRQPGRVEQAEGGGCPLREALRICWSQEKVQCTRALYEPVFRQSQSVTINTVNMTIYCIVCLKH